MLSQYNSKQECINKLQKDKDYLLNQNQFASRQVKGLIEEKKLLLQEQQNKKRRVNTSGSNSTYQSLNILPPTTCPY